MLRSTTVIHKLPAATALRARTMASLTHPRGRAALLEKKPDDIVITFAKRTVMGRAKKGQLKDVPVDEMLLSLFKATLKETKLDPAKVEDICVGMSSLHVCPGC
jgi:acetyl-CoA acyltransferase 1